MHSVERRLPHRRAGGDDDQVARLEARGEPVEVAVAGRDAGDLLAGLVERVIFSKLSFSSSSMWLNSFETCSWESSKTICSALSSRSCDLAGPVPAELGDLAAGAR